MNKKVVLLTGITGFLGSHIAEQLSKHSLVIGLTREQSNLWRYNEIRNDNILLIKTDNRSYREKIKELHPDILIHSAWGGVAANDRSDWITQSLNIPFTVDLLQLAKDCGIKRFIGLGSQAEYGYFSGKIDESYRAEPLSAYGACKLSTLELVKSFCTVNNMDWYCLRLFPMFGIREDLNWFLPMVIDHALNNKKLDLTPGEQQYSYLHVSDFSKGIERIIGNAAGNDSGMYNFAANYPMTLRHVVELIKNKVGKGNFNFGAIPYRDNQVMHMEGDAGKFFDTFSFFPEKKFEEGIDELIKYYQQKIN